MRRRVDSRYRYPGAVPHGVESVPATVPRPDVRRPLAAARPSPPLMTRRQLGALLLIAAVWGASFLFIRVLINAGVEPLGVSGGRLGLGLLGLVPFAFLARRQFPRSPGTLLGIATLGVVNFALPWSLIAYGERDISSGVASIANASLPLWAALLAAFVIPGERLGGWRVAGLFAGFGGVGVLAFHDAGGSGGDSVRGLILVVAAAMCYGVSVVAIRRWLRHVPAVPLTFGQVCAAAVILVPVAFATSAYEGAGLGAKEWLSLLALGFGGSAFAVVLYMWLIAQVGAVRASVVTYLLPPVGVSLGWLFLDESVGWNLLLGLALIIGGVGLVQGARLARVVARILPRERAAPASGD